MPRRIPLARLLALLGGLCLLPEGGYAQSVNYVRGKGHWLAARYPSAMPPLKSFRNERFGRSAEVDYMLGTSGCRVANQRVWGANVLNFVLYSYPLTPASDAMVREEWRRCRGLGRIGPLAADARRAVVTAIAAGAGARGKIFHFEDQSIAAYPARRTRELAKADLGARLVSIGRPAQIREALLPLAPAEARIRVIGRFAFVAAAGQSDEELDRIAAVLDQYVEFLVREYGLTVPDNYLTIYLVRDIESVRQVASRVHALDVSPSTLGYAFQDDLSTTGMVRSTEIGTITHELFHLLVRSSFGDIPQWLDEGMAGLYEVMEIRSGRFLGIANWRGRVLKQQWSERPTLAEVIASPWFAFDRTEVGEEPGSIPLERMAVHLATARYFTLYLQEKGKLAEIFRTLRDRDPGAASDPGAAAVALVEAQVGPIAQVQIDYDRWLTRIAEQPPCPPNPLAAPQIAVRAEQRVTQDQMSVTKSLPDQPIAPTIERTLPANVMMVPQYVPVQQTAPQQGASSCP